MNLYLISQDVNDGWDTYDSAVVAAKSEQEARSIHPSGRESSPTWDQTWTSPTNVKVELIGKAVPGTKAGVICSSFNAG